MGFYWTGTGFEERLAPPMPPPPTSVTTEPQHKAPVDGAIDLAASWPPAGDALQTEGDEAQKAAHVLEKHFSYQSEVRNAENRRKTDDAGSMSFDPVQGIWVRADKNNALFPAHVAPPAGIADDSSRGKGPSDTGSFFKWTSWFRTDAENGRALSKPNPVARPDAKAKPVAASESASDGCVGRAGYCCSRCAQRACRRRCFSIGGAILEYSGYGRDRGRDRRF